MKTKLILVEDDTDLGMVIKQYLEFSGFEVQWFQHPNLLLDDLQRSIQDVKLMILDVMMPEMDGFSLAKILNKSVQIPYLFLTAKGQSFDRILGLKLGAQDYITKPCEPEELLLRIHNILNRNQIFIEEIVLIGLYEFDPKKMQLKFENSVQQLTEKEVRLLQFLIQYNHQMVSRKAILEDVWGENDYFLGRSLDVFMTRLRKYFAADNTIKFESVRGVGFLIDFP